MANVTSCDGQGLFIHKFVNIFIKPVLTAKH